MLLSQFIGQVFSLRFLKCLFQYLVVIEILLKIIIIIIIIIIINTFAILKKKRTVEI